MANLARMISEIIDQKEFLAKMNDTQEKNIEELNTMLTEMGRKSSNPYHYQGEKHKFQRK